MKHKILFAVCCAFVFSSTAFAQAWQWKDKDGRLVISDTPPPKGTPSLKEVGKHIPQEDEPSDEERAKLNSQSDEEFQKRREERLKKEEEQQKAEEEAKNKKESCSAARQSLATRQASGVGNTPAQRAARRDDIQRLEEKVSKACD